MGNTDEPLATLWSDGQIFNLNDLVDFSLTELVVLQIALSINNNGQIAGQGRTATGLERSFILTPLPLLPGCEPSGFRPPKCDIYLTQVAAVPLPAGAWLLLSALGGLPTFERSEFT